MEERHYRKCIAAILLTPTTPLAGGLSTLSTTGSKEGKEI